MILLTTALYREAKPFIQKLGLKKDLNIRSHEVFRSEEYALIVSGIGKLQSAIATTLLINTFPLSEKTVIGNIGIAGSRNQEPGTLKLIHRVKDSCTGTCYYPEQLVKSSCGEALLETHEKAVTNPLNLSHAEALVDMEAAGFMQAASQFLDTGRIFLFKCVSDNLECGILSPDLISSLLEPHVEHILEYARTLSALSLSSKMDVLTEKERGMLSHVLKYLSLTQQEKHMLEKAAIGHKIRTGRLTEKLLPVTKIKIESVEHARIILQKTHAALNTP